MAHKPALALVAFLATLLCAACAATRTDVVGPDEVTDTAADVTAADAAGSPGPPPSAAPRDGGTESLLLAKAAILRAEDRRLVDDALRAALNAPEAELRAAAARALGRIGDPATGPELIRLTVDADPSVRARALYALGQLGDARAVSTLVQAAGDASPEVRLFTAAALGLLRDPASHQAIERLIGDPNDAVARSAANAVSNFPDFSFAVDELVALSAHPEATVALAGLQALSQLGSRIRVDLEAKRAARARLIEVAEANNPLVRMLVAGGLKIPAGPQETTTLAALVEDPHPFVRISALQSVSFPGAPVDPFLSAALADEDERVVLAALMGIGRIRGGTDTLQPLTRFVVYDERDWLTRVAIASLANVERETAGRMAAGFANSGPQIREATAEFLVGTTNETELKVVRKLLQDEDPNIRRAAVAAIGGAAEPLSELIGDAIAPEDPALCRAIAQAADVRVGLDGRSAEDVGDAIALLDQLWDAVSPSGDPTVLAAIVDAAAQVGSHGTVSTILHKAVEAGDRHVQLKAVAHLRTIFKEDLLERIGPATDLPIEHYEDVLRWAARPRAAIITVKRPGFRPGRFVIRLDTENTPLTSWHFARLAQSGFYDELPFHRLLPNSLIQTGDPDGDRRGGPGYTIRDERHPHEFGPGTVTMTTAGKDSSGSQWFATLTARPRLSGRYTAFGQVVQNLYGVVDRILPTDRVISIEVYEGDGTEALPAVSR